MKTEQALRTHTIRSIADAEGVDKDVVRKRYERAKSKWDGNLGEIIDGVRCFSDDEKAFLDGFAAEKRTPSIPAVEVGNHATVLPNPEGLQTVNLQRFRSTDIQSVSFEDTDELLSMIDQGLAAVESAMSADINRRRQKLNHDEQIKGLVSQRIQDFKLKEMQYRIETSITDNQQTQSADALGKLLAQFQQLQDGE